MAEPNILFIITDQHRAADTGFMGNQVVRTPNMDHIAASGMVFDNTWVSNPIRMPNRSSIMTGRMPSSHGVVFNDRAPLIQRVGTNTSILRSTLMAHLRRDS